MTERLRYPHAVALAVAEELKELLTPACERIEIAGSLRRGKPDVGDIELLVIPGVIRRDADLFGVFTTVEDALNTRLQILIQEDVLALRTNTRGLTTYGPKNKLLLHVLSGLPVDVFSTTLENWGMALVVRTGPAEFNIRMMARFRYLGMRGHAYGGVTYESGEEFACPNEATVFRLLGWPYLEPAQRGP